MKCLASRIALYMSIQQVPGLYREPLASGMSGTAPQCASLYSVTCASTQVGQWCYVRSEQPCQLGHDQWIRTGALVPVDLASSGQVYDGSRTRLPLRQGK